MTGLLLLRAPVEHWHPRSVAHLALLREVAHLAPVYLLALQADADDARAQLRAHLHRGLGALRVSIHDRASLLRAVMRGAA